MKTFSRVLGVMAVLVVLSMTGCASSFQDRADAIAGQDDGQSLTPPADDPAGDPTGGTTVISRDDIPLSGACIVNADCASTQFCELGQCVSECNAGGRCEDGRFCSARGKCVSDSEYVDVNPAIKATPPASWSVDERVIRLDPGDDDASFNLQVNGGGDLQYRVQVEPADARDAVTISSDEGTVAEGQSLNLEVAVNREAFGEGDHRISVNLISDGGQHIVIVDFSNGVEGRYAGFVQYTDPGLGRVPVVVDVDVDESGAVAGRIYDKASLLFPDERSVAGSYDASQKSIFFSTVDLYESGGDFDPFERNIGREVYFYGELTEQRVIKGTFEEVISGLLPQVMSVEGEFYLKRNDVDFGEVEVLGDPAMPAYPAAASSYAVCDGFSPSCNDFVMGFPSNMMGCSQDLRSTAFGLGDDFLGTDGGGNPVVNMGLVEECKEDVALQGSGSCADIQDLECLRGNQQHYILSNVVQTSEYREYFQDLMGLQRLYAFIGNDLLVDAYRIGVQTVSSPLTQELLRLEDALEKYGVAERAFFETENIAIVGDAASVLVSENNFELLRVPLEYMRSSQAALARIASLTMRKDIEWASKRDELRRRIQEHARIIFLEGIAIAKLASMHGGAFEYELAQVADELRSVERTAATLEASLNPLGFPVDYVPFIYDPAQSLQPTNFHQLVEMATPTVANAVQKAQTANGTVELMEVRTEEIQQRMLEIEQSFETEIQQICGISSVDLLGECGQSGGELAVAYNDIEQQYFQIEKIHQQIADLNQMVKIKRDTAIQVMNIKQNTLVFLQSSGAEMEALDIAEGEIRAAMLRKKGFFSSIGGFFSGIAQIGAGIASAVMTAGTSAALQGGLAAAGGISGGMSSCVNAGLGLASTAQSASAALQFADVAKRKTHIRNLQQMRMKEEDIEVTALQYAEAVKMMLVQMAQLNLDLELADIRLAQLVIRANNMLQRVDQLYHQREVLIAQAQNSVNNPMSNLSFRIKRDHAVLMAANEFEKALADVYLAARGLEHELNVDLQQIESQLMQAGSAQQLQDFLTCLEGWHYDYAIAFGSPHQEVTRLSLREDVLGFADSITDEVTGEVITPQELFRRVLLDPKHITQSGRVEFPFITSITGGNKQFSTLVCNDRIKQIRVMFVGDFLGDNEATVVLKQEGDSYLRDCAAEPSIGEDILNTYHLDQRNALVQSGVNDFGLADASHDLTGRSVASDRWVLIIPTGDEAPNNQDIDFLNIDDVVIEITHEARTLNGGAPTSVFGQCNI